MRDSIRVWTHQIQVFYNIVLISTEQKQYMYICVCVLVTQLCLTFCTPMDCSPPGSSVHGILQTRILVFIAIPFSRGSFWLRDQTWFSYVAGGSFTIWAKKHEQFDLMVWSQSCTSGACKKLAAKPRTGVSGRLGGVTRCWVGGVSGRLETE